MSNTVVYQADPIHPAYLHELLGPAPLWVAQERLPRAAGALLLQRGSRQGLRQGRGGGALQGRPLFRDQDRRHQCGGHARPVGVPG